MDRETKRTRNRLRLSLMKLMRIKEYEVILVSEIIESGDVALSTFYRHYANKFELLEDMIQHLADFIDATLYTSHVSLSELLNPDGIRPALPIFKFIEAEKIFIRHLLHVPSAHLVFNALIKSMIKSISTNTPELSAQEIETIASAMLGNIYNWVLSDTPYSAEEMANRMHWLTTYGTLLQRLEFSDIQVMIHEKMRNNNN